MAAAVGESVQSKEPLKVSVCVVTYNQEKYIAQCLQSIVDQETDFDFEIIVGDDCSTDGTREIIKNFAKTYPVKIKPVFNDINIGPFKNYISVHRECSGEYICHLDGDDQFHPQKLSKLVTFLDSGINSDCVAVVHKLSINNSDLKSTGRNWPQFFRNKKLDIVDVLKTHPAFGHSSLMYKKGGLLEIFKRDVFLDLDVFLQLASKGKIGVIDEVLGAYTAGVGISSKSNLINLVEDAICRSADLGVECNIVLHALSAQNLEFAKKNLVEKRMTDFRYHIERSCSFKVLSMMQVLLWLFRNNPILILKTYKVLSTIRSAWRNIL